MTNYAANYVSRALEGREQILKIETIIEVDDESEVASLLAQILQSGALIAQYVASSAARRSTQSTTHRLNDELLALWCAEKQFVVFDQEILSFVVPALTTIRLFVLKGSSELSEQRRQTLGHLLEFFDDNESDLRTQVLAMSDDIFERTRYNSEDQATRAINPWLALEALTGAANSRAIVTKRESFSIERRNIGQKLVVSYQELRNSPTIEALKHHGASYEYHAPMYARSAPEISQLRKETDADIFGDRTQKVWFATDRISKKSPGNSLKFLNDRDPLNRVRYGYCLVDVPQSHKLGSVGPTGLKAWVLWNADKKLKITGKFIIERKQDFFTGLNLDLAASDQDRKSLLVYVHGYNTDFKKAVVRAGQLGFDLNKTGVTALYSWPSTNKAKGYTSDLARIDTSVNNFAHFVIDLVKKSKATKISLLVHSMGNKLLIGALPLITKALLKESKRLENIIMAAPDVDNMLWKQGMTKTNRVAKRATMYVSDRDKALDLSHCLSASPRAGYRDPVTVVKGIDTIDVSFIDMSLLGHGYYAELHPVLYDIHTLVHTDLDPSARISMAKEADTNGKYWSIRP